MTGPAVWPRPYQVAELTHGLRLPTAAIAKDHFEILVDGLRKAHKDIKASQPSKLGAGDELDVNALMEARLNRMIDEDPLWGKLVFYVARGKESISFDGSHRGKSPDFSIVLSDTVKRFPLIAEAKIIDHAKSKTVRLYCREGVLRFVNGEYAWGNREAFMIGYVRDGSSTDSTLRSFLLIPSNSKQFQLRSQVMSTSSPDLAYTLHDRHFTYGKPPQNPAPIMIWHLWLT